MLIAGGALALKGDSWYGCCRCIRVIDYRTLPMASTNDSAMLLSGTVGLGAAGAATAPAQG